MSATGADGLTVTWTAAEGDVCRRFSLRTLYDEIKAGISQPALF